MTVVGNSNLRKHYYHQQHKITYLPIFFSVQPRWASRPTRSVIILHCHHFLHNYWPVSLPRLLSPFLWPSFVVASNIGL